MTVPFAEAIDDRGDRWMFQLGKGIRLAVKILDRSRPLFGIGEPIENLLDGTATIRQALVLGNIYQPHASTGQEALDAVTPGKQRPRLKLTILIAEHGRILRYS